MGIFDVDMELILKYYNMHNYKDVGGQSIR